MKLELRRESPPGQPRTFGRLSIIDACLTLEDMVRDGPKVQGETAIPAGRYKVTLQNSPRFGIDTITLTGLKPDGTVYELPGTVHGFDGIRMHGGNTEKDSEGCPLLGLEYLPNGAGIRNSAPAVDMVKNAIRGARARGEEVWLEII